MLAVSLTLALGDPVNAAQDTANQDTANRGAASDGAIEARVGVRWLPGGHAEVIFQVRSDDGDWGPRRTPEASLLPTDALIGRWLTTRPAALHGAEIRIAARRLPGRAVEAAVRVRALDGDWSERILPGQRRLTPARSHNAQSWASPVTLAPERAQILSFYGFPGVRAMGVLGHGTPDEVAEDVAGWVRRYDDLNGPRGVVGAYHLIVGVAQSQPTSDGRWLGRMSHERIAEYVEAAREHGMLLFIDNQIGWSDPLTEVRRLEEFLKEPHVHMALDPEFATEPLGVRPGLAIGGITGHQVNEVLGYLSALVEQEGLPPKILMVHQFAGRMLHDRDVIERHAGVELSIDMDGIGSPKAKLRGYGLFAITEPSQRPAFKLFFTQDTPLMTPEEVQALERVPDLIIYQ